MQQQPQKDNNANNSSKNKDEEHTKVEDHILRRFDLQEFKGKGAYGVVWKAVDRKTKEVVALKKVFDAFHNATDSQRTYREVIFLEQLTHHENIIRMKNVIKAENNKDLYMVFDFMETDLHKVIRANILEPIHKKYIIYQLIKAIKYIHSADLIHRDLKPSNLLINSECKIKVADFGLARTVNANNEDIPVMTEYVATRWYRAPEILLGSQMYSKAVDMWSVGCILGEMITGKAIFPGTSTLNQIERIIELLGRPKTEDLISIQSQLALNVLQNISTQKKKSIAQVFEGGCEDSIDFIRKCLVYNPKKRLTVEQGLAHPYVREFKGTEDEIVKESPIETYMDDNHKYSVKEYRDALYNHINNKKKLDHKNLIIRNLQQIQPAIKQQIEDKLTSAQSPSKKTTTTDKEVDLKGHSNNSEKIISTKYDKDDVILEHNRSKEQIIKKQMHHKSQSYISPQYMKQISKKNIHQSTQQSQEGGQDYGVTFSASQSPIMRQKNAEQRQTAVVQFPNVEGKINDSTSPTNKLMSRKSSIEKKLRSTISPSQITSQINNNYFLNGTSIKNQIQEVLEKKRTPGQASSQNNSLVKNNIGTIINQTNNYFSHIKSQSYIDKGLSSQYTQYMSLKGQMGVTNYGTIFQQKIKMRK